MADLESKNLCGEADEQSKVILCRPKHEYIQNSIPSTDSNGAHRKQYGDTVGRPYLPTEQEIANRRYGSRDVHVHDLPRLSNESVSKYFSCSSGVKRNRSSTGGERGEISEGREVQDEKSKRARGECFRCGGRDHIVLFCTSTERDARKNLSLPQCRACNGRGHESNNCPTLVKVNRCYNCKQEGHFARNCPYDNNKSQSYANTSSIIPDLPAQNHHIRKYESQNLNDSIEKQLQLYGYSSPEQLYAALRLASVSGSHYNNEYRNEQAFRAGTYFNNSVSYGRSYQPYYATAPIKSSRAAKTQRKSEKCFRCGMSGHWTKNCPQRPAGADPNGCFKCGKYGHKSKDCNVCYNCGVEGHVASSCPNK